MTDMALFAGVIRLNGELRGCRPAAATGATVASVVAASPLRRTTRTTQCALRYSAAKSERCDFVFQSEWEIAGTQDRCVHCFE